MKLMKTSLLILLMLAAMPMTAQTNQSNLNKKLNTRVRVEVVNGKKALVLKTGIKNQTVRYNYSDDIVIAFKDDTRMILDSLVAAPWGSAVKLKDVNGYTVDVAKANVNTRIGLMFSSGTKLVAITKEELDSIK